MLAENFGAKIMSAATPEKAKHWSVGREIPVAMLAGMVAQIIFGIWYVSKMDSRLGTLEEKYGTLISDMNDQKTQNAARLVLTGDDRGRMIKVETQVGFILDILKRVETQQARNSGNVPN